MCKMVFKVVIFTFYATILTLGAFGEETNDTDVSYVPLVRKRRYLTFPVGTSLQLVYCLTVPMIGPYGAFITVGSTAALAWPLPATAEEILELKGKRTTTTEPPTTLPPLIHDHHHHDDYDYPDSSFKRIDKPFNSFKYRSKLPNKSYYNPFTYNKPLYEYSPKINYKQKIYGKTFHNDYKVPATYVHPVYYDVHRRTRRELYGRVEKLFKALNRDGKACLLKAICEVSQAGEKKGTLIMELLKAVFRIKPHENYPEEDHYDSAANKNHNCQEQYPTCENSIWGDMLF